jgi:CRP-like cAMP-binding protein
MIEDATLERLGLLTGLSAFSREEVRAAFRTFEVGPGEALLAEGETDRSMLILLEGELVVSLGGLEISRIHPGQTAGEMALFGTFDRRAATVTTLTEARALLIDDEGIKYLRLKGNPVARLLEVRALGTISHRLRDTNEDIARMATSGPVEAPRARGFLSRVATALGISGDLPRTPPPDPVEALRSTPGFVGRDPEILASIAARLDVMAIPMGDTIIEEGSPAKDAYIVASGRVGVFRTIAPGRTLRLASLGPGYAFGQVALADDGLRSATCRALEPLYLLHIPGDVYHALVLENSPEGRTFRRGMVDGLSLQLRLANEHLLTLHEDRGGIERRG